MSKYNPFVIIRGLIILAFTWPALIPLGFRSWQIKRGNAQRTPFEGAAAGLTAMMCVPLTIVIYLGLAAWWYF